MPRRNDISSILLIGSGPIVIGQACEFDYSGTQACKALKEEGFRVILVNSNPATIMTDPGLVDATYIEPITAEVVAKIIGYPIFFALFINISILLFSLFIFFNILPGNLDEEVLAVIIE